VSSDVAAQLSLPFDDFFLARQPILGRDQHLVAFELLFRTAGSNEANVTDDAAATAAVISHASQLGMEQVVGAQLAFVNVNAVALMSDYVRFLPADKVILEILETVKATPELLARVAELKSLGFKFALDDVVAESDDVRALLDLVDVIKIDVKGVAPARLPALTQSLRRQNKKLLAEKVETVEEFRQCLELGFEYFQGFYFARPAILSGKKIAPSELAILHLLELVNSEADNRTIELAVKRDALISLNLLRLVNTPAAGARGRIDTLGQAIEVLGRQQLQRWLQILLYATPGAKVELNLPLLQMATTRGKMLELMSLKMHPGQQDAADTGFTVGIMSLTDALFSMAMDEILDTVDVADDVRAALLYRQGEYGDMLNVVEMLEKARCGKPLATALRHLDLTSKDLREIELAAFNWINELAQEVH
jgi:EAL and modified HD-GYP domain-containing signal transduction protein